VVGIRIFVEGGGDSETTRSKLRKGFGVFLQPLVELVRQHKQTVTWRGIVACGPRKAAYDDFCTAVKQYPDDLNILLVDAEEALSANASDSKRRNWEHLKRRQGDQWDCPKGVEDDQCFLMIQCMETWLIADRAALKKYYGQGFNEKALPASNQLEAVAKERVASSLKQATAKTQKGEYHKINHAFEILERVNVDAVRKALPECDRLFTELEQRITQGNP
jgi:hypothetical protein